MASGVAVQDDVVTKYEELKMGKKCEYLTMKITDDKKSICTEKMGTAGQDRDNSCELTNKERWQIFVEENFKDDHCCYAVYDFKWDHLDPALGSKTAKSKLLFIAWTPDTAPLKAKMLAASSKDALKKKLTGYAVELQCNGKDEVEFDDILETASKKK